MLALLAHSQLEQASHRPGVGIFRIESDDAIVISKSLVEIFFLSENEGTIEIGRDQIWFQTYGTVEIELAPSASPLAIRARARSPYAVAKPESSFSARSCVWGSGMETKLRAPR